jgi:hypothetical protein
MPQRASVFCNFYIRVDREALVSERALDVGSVAFKAMSTKKHFWLCQLCLCYNKNEPFMVDFKFAKFHCYQQIQSFLIHRIMT